MVLIPIFFRPDSSARLRIRKELNIPENAPVVGTVARYDALKDFPTFFEATRHLNQQGVYYVLAGKGLDPDNQELKLLMEQNPEGKFLLLGERSDIPEVLTALDVFTLCSVTEGFPNALGEAMACGVSSVATDVGDVKVLMGDTGSLVPPHSAKELARGWEKHLKMSASERQQFGRQARQRICEKFSIEKAYRRYREVYAPALSA